MGGKPKMPSLAPLYGQLNDANAKLNQLQEENARLRAEQAAPGAAAGGQDALRAEEAATNERAMGRRARGRAATILTSPRGVPDEGGAVPPGLRTILG